MSDTTRYLAVLRDSLESQKLPASPCLCESCRTQRSKALTYALRAIEERDELLIACKAFVTAYEKCLQLEKTDHALRLCRIAIEKAEAS